MDDKLPSDVKRRVEQWLSEPYDEETRRQVRNLLDHDREALIDAFYTTVAFGTGGMRALMGIGTNRLNTYTIRSATQGLANYILSQNKKKPSVYISYDSRKNSQLFAEESARVLAGNGIEVFLTRELRPTPFVSFGCRHHGCTAAIMITASHNPRDYNGYKVYWSDGAQVVPPHDSAIMDAVKKIETPNQVELAPLTHPLIHTVGEEDDSAYFEALEPLQNFPDDNQDLGPKLHVVYSPLHGCGITTLPEALRRWGFTSISYVEEQEKPDGSFPSAHTPNPEQEAALKLGIKKLSKVEGDIFIATDPDADRLGLVVMHQGAPVILNGNQIAALCIYYLCTTLSKQGRMAENAAFVTTIVTTDLFSLIAASFNKSCFKVLTGFKYIGEKIHQWEEKNEYTFIFGAEESLGFLYGTHSRDKDATAAACLICEMALQQKKEGKTLIDLLNEIYAKFGPFKEKQLSVHFGDGMQGVKKMNQLMETLRAHPPKEICGQEVVIIDDYLTLEKKNLATNANEKLLLPT
ncbi:MAG: Phosphoglucomutase, partial [Chlamydiae bacterium]|nr:Phosphoglucomutase [Chlamydiota bacterium]